MAPSERILRHSSALIAIGLIVPLILPSSGSAAGTRTPQHILVNTPYIGTIARYEIIEAYVTVPATAVSLAVDISNATDDVDLYVRWDAPPDLSSYRYDYASATYSFNESVSINFSSNPPLKAGDLYITIDGYFLSGSTADFDLYVTVVNGTGSPPILSMGAVTPAAGTVNDAYNFTVVYTDADNQAPVSIGLEVAQTSYPLTLLPGGDGDFTNGETYGATVQGTSLGVGAHAWTFSASDGVYQTSLTGSGPSIGIADLVNGQPVTQTIAASERQYFRIVIPANAHTLTVTLNSTDDLDLMVNYGRTEYYGTDSDFYTWTGTSGSCSVVVGPTTTPSLTPGDWYITVGGYTAGGSYTLVAQYNTSSGGTNHAPVLSNGSVTPSTGNLTTVFRYAVTYTDADDDPPTAITVGIDGANFPMNETDPLDTVYADGKGYYFEIDGGTLYPPSQHRWGFNASDGQAAAAPLYGTGPTVTPSAGPVQLQNHVPHADSIATSGEEDSYLIILPAGVKTLYVNTTGTSDDIDLYLRFGQQATTTAYDYRAYTSSGDESIEVIDVAGIQAGNWYVLVVGYQGATSSYTIVAEWYATSPLSVVNLTSGVPYASSISVSGEEDYYRISVPTGSTELIISTTGTTADLDLHVAFNRMATSTNYDFRPWTTSGDETVTVDSSTSPSIQAGDWYIMVNGYKTATSPYTITATYYLAVQNNPPVLSAGSVAPGAGDLATSFVFSVTYTDADNDAPSFVSVTVNGTSYTMTPGTGADGNYANGEPYSTTLLGSYLGVGAHTYLFNASDGQDFDTLGPLNGPTVTGSAPSSDGNDDPANATDITGQTTVIGTLDETTDVDDWYMFWMDGGATDTIVTVTMTGDAGTDFDLYLFDSFMGTPAQPLGEYLAFAANATYPEQLEAESAYSCFYYLNVNAYSGAGSYTLTLVFSQVTSEGENNHTTGTPTTNGTTRIGSVDQAMDHYDWFIYSATAPYTLELDLTASNCYWANDGTYEHLTVLHLLVLDGTGQPLDDDYQIDDGSLSLAVNTTSNTVYVGVLASFAIMYEISTGQVYSDPWTSVHADYELTFTEIGGTAPADTVPPSILATFPAKNAVNVSVSAVVKANFSEPIDPATLTSQSFTLTGPNGTVAGVVSWNAMTRQAILEPAQPLDLNTTYSALITTAVTDLAGNPLAANYAWNFTTAAQASSPTLPTVVSTVPEDQATDVPTTTHVEIRFSMAMNHSATERAINITPATPATFTWYDTLLRIEPVSDLAESTTYTVSIASGRGGAQSSTGEPLDGNGNGLQDGPIADRYVFSFTTAASGDKTPPTVTAHSPADGATSVDPWTVISLTFSEKMDVLSVEAAFSTDPQVAGQFAWQGNTVTFTPDRSFTPGETYVVTLAPTASDVSGNTIDVDGDGVGSGSPKDAYTFSFQIKGDKDPPTVVSVLPTADASNVPVGSVIVVSFSEPMDQASLAGAFSLRPSVAGSFTWAGPVATFTPDEDLAPGTEYTVTILSGPGGAKDQAGNMLDGNADGLTQGSPTDDYVWSFTTEIPAVLEPLQAVPLVPRPGSVGVSVDTVVKASFSRVVLLESLASGLVVSNGTTTVNGSFDLDEARREVTFTPAAPLAFETTYTVTLGLEIKDVLGSSLESPVTWNFTTELAPPPVEVMMVLNETRSPAPGSTGVARDANVSVSFTLGPDPVSVQAGFRLRTMSGGIVPASVSVDGATAVLDPIDLLDANTTYIAEVTAQVRTPNGTPVSFPTQWNFTTGPSSGGGGTGPGGDLPALVLRSAPPVTVRLFGIGVDATVALAPSPADAPAGYIFAGVAFHVNLTRGTLAWANITVDLAALSSDVEPATAALFRMDAGRWVKVGATGAGASSVWGNVTHLSLFAVFAEEKGGGGGGSSSSTTSAANAVAGLWWLWILVALVVILIVAVVVVLVVRRKPSSDEAGEAAPAEISQPGEGGEAPAEPIPAEGYTPDEGTAYGQDANGGWAYGSEPPVYGAPEGEAAYAPEGGADEWTSSEETASDLGGFEAESPPFGEALDGSEDAETPFGEPEGNGLLASDLIGEPGGPAEAFTPPAGPEDEGEDAHGPVERMSEEERYRRLKENFATGKIDLQTYNELKKQYAHLDSKR